MDIRKQFLGLIFSVLVIGNTVVGQTEGYQTIQMPNLMAPSPDAFQLGTYGTMPIGLFTGSANYNIPVYDIKTSKLSLPISLSYNSNGVKVDMVSSRVGMGWVLNAGGVISKTVMGLDDDLGQLTAPPQDLLTPSVGLKDYLEGVADGSIDAQPDKYTFNFNGITGSFIIDHNGEIITIPYHPNLKIVRNSNVNHTEWNFLVTAPDGVKYYFGGTSAKERGMTTNGGSGCNNMTYNWTDNAWYLNKIVHPLGDEILLTYSSKTFYYYTSFSQTISKLYPLVQLNEFSCNPIPGLPTPKLSSPSDEYSNCYTRTGIQSKILSKITFPQGSIRFKYSSRFDLIGDSALSSIEVYKKNSTTALKKYQLQQTYAGTVSSYENSFISDEGGSQRLFLTGFLEKDPLSNTNGAVYYFEYEEMSGLPPRLSMAQDHFGYFNGVNNTYFVPATSGYNNIFSVVTGNRAPNPAYSQKGLLKKIIYPTGGYNQIFYEQNKIQASGVGYNYGNQPIINGHLDVGGSRVAKVISFDPVALKTEVKKFHYAYLDNLESSSGLLIWNPIYVTDRIIRKYCPPPPPSAIDCGYYDWTMKVLSSNSLYPLYGASSGNLVYHEVIESLGENFENGGISHKYLVTADGAAQIISGDYIQSSPVSNFGLFNGLEEKTIYFSKNGSVIIKRKEIERKYTNLIDAQSKIHGIFRTDTSVIVNKRYYIPCNSSGGSMSQADLDCFDINRYFTFSYYNFNHETITYDYNESGASPVVTVVENKYDNYENVQLTRSIKYNSDQTAISTHFKYPFDFKAPGNIYQKMVDANIVNPVVEQTVKSNTTTLYSIKTNYKDWFSNGNTLVPWYVDYIYKTNSPVTRLRYHLYSNSGNPLEISKEHDVKVSYIWDEENVFPLAEVTNAMENEVAFANFEGQGNGKWNLSGGAVSSQHRYTGRKSFTLIAGNTISKTGLSAGKTYKVSYWKKSGSVLVNGLSGTSGITRNGWTYYEHLFSNSTTATIAGTAQIDELRLHPLVANMISYNYDPLIGIISSCDNNNNVSTYEYDNLGRLIIIRDQDNNILKKICYNYAGQPENCTVYYNVVKSGTYSKICGAGYQGSSVTYTVPANTYSAATQAIANQLAQDDVNANGQNYANATGTCTLLVCNTSACTANGPAFKCVNGICEQGIKVYTQSIPKGGGQFTCIYHYEWSDGSWSGNYTEYNSPVDCVTN